MVQDWDLKQIPHVVFRYGRSIPSEKPAVSILGTKHFWATKNPFDEGFEDLPDSTVDHQSELFYLPPQNERKT